MTHSTLAVTPAAGHRPTAVLHYDDYCDRVLGEKPVEHLRRQLRGLHRLSQSERVVTTLAIRELIDAKRPLHWRDVERPVRRHYIARGRRPLTDDQFWVLLAPALSVGVISCRWDSTWGAAA